jgi:5'-3' exonuclease
MGVPKLFKIILEKFPKSHSASDALKFPSEYLFIDFNGIIYESFEAVSKQIRKDGGETSKTPKIPVKSVIEERIIAEVITLTKNMIVNIVKPTKLVYIAFDGTPPRGKMLEQRARRYKKLYNDEVLAAIHAKYNVNHPAIWDRTYITPGTQFMYDMSQALQKAIENEVFPGNLQYILSDTSVPGEGEQKFLPYLDVLPASKITIYSNDGDILILAHRFPQHEVKILAIPRDTFEESKTTYKDQRYMYLHMNEIDTGLVNYFQKITNIHEYNANHIKRDFAFFTMLGGNDFVKHIFYLRLKEEHSARVLLGVYQALLPRYGHLVKYNKEKKIYYVNQRFLLAYMKMLAYQELKWCKKIQEKIQNSKPRRRDKNANKNKDKEPVEPWEEEWNNFQHNSFYKSDHPLYEKYKDLFYLIDFSDKNWKNLYYKAFFHVDYANIEQITEICIQYLQSWFYCFLYYFKGVPSWRWHYPYHASPLPSDLAAVLSKIPNINVLFKFNKDKPFTPLELLMLVLPPQNDLLPPEYIKVMESMPQYYPKKFELNALWGQKFIYADPILPELNVDEILNAVKKIKLDAKYSKLNEVSLYPLVYT